MKEAELPAAAAAAQLHPSMQLQVHGRDRAAAEAAGTLSPLPPPLHSPFDNYESFAYTRKAHIVKGCLPPSIDGYAVRVCDFGNLHTTCAPTRPHGMPDPNHTHGILHVAFTNSSIIKGSTRSHNWPRQRREEAAVQNGASNAHRQTCPTKVDQCQAVTAPRPAQDQPTVHGNGTNCCRVRQA